MIKQLMCAVLCLFWGISALAEPLRVGVDPNLKPFVYQEASGELAGFDVDVAKEICSRLNRDCVFVNTDWDGLIPSLNTQKVDVLITAMSITEDREKVVDFSRPYYKSPSQLLVKHAIEQPKTIGVLRGSVDETFAKHQFKSAKVLSYTNQMEALMDLQFGRLDAVFGPRIELEHGLTDEQAANFYFTGPVYDDLKFFGPGIGMAVRENDPLLDEINEAIIFMRADGTWQKFADRYFEVDIWAY